MLSLKSRPFIDASVPVLREHGVTITRTFYRNMFAAHPELTNLFNMGNQANGSQQQSLASAVFAYAANYENADALAPVVSRIVHKHVSVGITAEHYPIVGHHLLGAIQETLGDAATPELLAAWAEAYGLLADALIAAEKALYAEHHTAPGEYRKLRVTDAVPQSEFITAYTLEPIDDQAPWTFTPGQYLTVAVNLPTGQRQLRQYSLSDAPGKNVLRISVKREPGVAETPAGCVSTWLHRTLKAGSVVEATPPCGDFAPARGEGPIVLLSAGVGITPMISALNQIAAETPERPVLFAHAARDRENHAHRADVAAAKAAMPHLETVTFYERTDNEDTVSDIHAGLMDAAKLPAWSYADTDVYLCGPMQFMRAQACGLQAIGVPLSNIHREVFGPEMLDSLSWRSVVVLGERES